MFYEKIELGSTLRVIECPKCKNEEFGKDADFCRICGSHLHNKCEGEWNDRDEYVVQHDNPGNARFCETCGKPTYFFTNGFLDAQFFATSAAILIAFILFLRLLFRKREAV